MIETKHLLGWFKMTMSAYDNMAGLTDEDDEAYLEIVARLRAYDKLKEGIKRVITNLCHDSNGVDK